MPTPREAFTNTVDRQGVTNARMRPGDFGAAGETLGRAVSTFGQNVGQVAEQLNQIQKIEAETIAQDADNMRNAEVQEAIAEFKTLQGKAAVDAAPELTKRLEEIDRRIGGEVLKNNNWARRMYDEVGARRRGDLMGTITSHAATERKTWIKSTRLLAMKTEIDNAVTNVDNPEVLEKAILTAGNHAVASVYVDGIRDNEMLEAARKEGQSKAIAAAAERMETRSPAEALAFVTLNVGKMDPQIATKLMGSLAPSAAQETAFTDVKSHLVYTSVGQQVAAPTVTTSPTGGNAAPTPNPGFDAIHVALLGVETPGGAHTDRNGRLITSRAGAQGKGQIMPATGPNPGYGVKPLQNHSEAEHTRFSKDYLAAMTKEFGGNITLGLTAYNWGVGKVHDHIKRVGDPRKGQISDAAFVNSIPVKEAREYASKVLSRVGVNVAGAASPQQETAPTYEGQEINLLATIERIEANPEIPYVQKQALIGAAQKLHGLGRQAAAEAEERLMTAVLTETNRLGEGFTDVNQLPLTLRQQLTAHPDRMMYVQNLAAGNERARQAEIRDRQDQRNLEIEQQLMTMSYLRPEEFRSLDLTKDKRFAGMGTAKITEWQQRVFQHRQQAANQDKKGSVNYARIRADVGRFVTGDVRKDQIRMGTLFTEAQKRAENKARMEGRSLTDAEYEAIALEVTQIVTVPIADKEGKPSGKTTRLYRGDVTARLGQNQTVRAETNIRDTARISLQRMLGRVPFPYEIDAWVEDNADMLKSNK